MAGRRSIRRVGLLINDASDNQRLILSGILAWHREHGHWQIRTRGFLRAEWGHGAAPARGGPGGVRAQARQSQGGHCHGPATLGEETGDDVAIPAVVARSAERHHRAPAVISGDDFRDRPARRLHQLDARHTAGDGNGIGLCHFRATEKEKIVSGNKVAHRCFSIHVARAIGAADRN